MMNMTKLLAGLFLTACLFTSSVMAQSPTWSRGTFGNVGQVGQIRSNSIILDDVAYRLSPTAKFTTVDDSSADIGLLKVKQLVGFNIIKINNRLLVDHLWLIPADEKSLYRR